MKRFKFQMGGSYIYYFGYTMGEAIQHFMVHRANRVSEITSIIEEPLREYEKP